MLYQCRLDYHCLPIRYSTILCVCLSFILALDECCCSCHLSNIRCMSSNRLLIDIYGCSLQPLWNICGWSSYGFPFVNLVDAWHFPRMASFHLPRKVCPKSGGTSQLSSPNTNITPRIQEEVPLGKLALHLHPTDHSSPPGLVVALTRGVGLWWRFNQHPTNEWLSISKKLVAQWLFCCGLIQ